MSAQISRRAFLPLFLTLGGCDITYVLVKAPYKVAAVYVPKNSEGALADVLKTFARNNQLKYSAWLDDWQAQVFELKNSDLLLELYHHLDFASEEYSAAILREGNFALRDIEMDRTWNSFRSAVLTVKGIDRWIDKEWTIRKPKNASP